MNREYHKWFSSVLQREMELLVFGDAGRMVLFFPTRTARFYDYENWKVIDALRKPLEDGDIQIFCVDSVDAESFYNAGIPPWQRIDRHLLYEHYIMDEVLPFMYSLNPTTDVEVAGCSMGAYHAVNLGLKYPDYFKKVVGMSGRYDLTKPVQNFRDLFDGFENETIYFNMPSQYMLNLNDENILARLRRMEIILAIGETDPFLFNNQLLSDAMTSKGITNKLYIWEGEAHRPRHWQKMVQLYL